MSKSTESGEKSTNGTQAQQEHGANPFELGAQFVQMMQDVAKGQTERFEAMRAEWEATMAGHVEQLDQMGKQVQALSEASVGYAKELAELWRTTTLDLVEQANGMLRGGMFRGGRRAA